MKTTEANTLEKAVLAKFPDGGNLFFTADTHFGHANIILFNKRPFRDLEDMDRGLVERWNATVPEDGVVFHLGDFCMGGPTEWNELLDRLHGKIYLILGNHDIRNIKQGAMGRFELVSQQMTIRVGDQPIILNHNPFLCYGGSYRDTWQLFGHVHSGPAAHAGLDHPRLKMLFPMQYDVGVDNNDYRPVSFSEVRAKIEAQVAAAREAAGVSVREDNGVSRVVFLDPAMLPATEAQRAAYARLEAACRVVRMDGSDGLAVQDAISRWVSLAPGEVRFAYVGTQAFDDYRYILADRGSGLTEGNVDMAMRILK